MFKTRPLGLDALAQRRKAVVKPRLYKFPPLKKSWQKNAVEQVADEPGFSAEVYEQQLTQGFNDGLNRGFAEGMEEGKSEGYQEGVRLGFDEGMRKGLVEGKAQTRQQFQEAVEPIDKLIDQLDSFLVMLEARRREELLQLVEKVTRQVIRCELTLNPTQILTLVEEALSALPQQPSKVKVLLNSEEFRRINDTDPEKAVQWGLSADPEMAAGECRVVTESEEIDIGCEHRLDQCMSALKDNLLPEAQNG